MEVGTKAFKRKQGDVQLPKVADCKIRIVEKCPEVSPPSIDLSNLPCVGPRKKHFQFENMWFMEPSCKEVIEHAWSSTMCNDAVENLVAKLDTCSAALSKWNTENLGMSVAKLVNWKLEDTQRHSGMDEKGANIVVAKGLFRLPPFHTRALARKTKNTIAGLYDSCGVWRSGEEELADIITN
ncbi:hypothetical protein Cgig2_015902 [Carnegiea gigantea]|uniref:Uncharacterized protein n=1 Tax=Carnegiea gigantea TaxID=171969 RepID=A0A9Q1GQP4_9CARY|nr:hypothetical protein Cgig2_015902 [Carnegiea gigantea]